MQNLRLGLFFTIATAAITTAVIACGDDDAAVPTTPADGGLDTGPSTSDSGSALPRGPEPAGASCSVASQCYAGVDGGADGGAIVGDVTCLDKIPNGYCTHTCTQDTECCAAPGECRTAVKQVCSPFENQPAQYCFLSCEEDDIARAIAANADAGFYDGGTPDGGEAADAYCHSFAGTATSCRSSGGGSENRKVCVPKE